ncbi:hypothetical protein C7U61_18150 [Rhizobium sp. JAB6]|nr:hypothetical protein C7U61_18150 [Rhizobium sp. JAB6]
MSAIRRRFVPHLNFSERQCDCRRAEYTGITAGNIVQVVRLWMDWLIGSELHDGIVVRADLHVAMLFRRNTTYSREQMRYLLLSAIRHRFVQALINVLMAAAYACIY